MIEMAVPFEDFLFDTVAEGLNIRTMDGRATFSKRAAPMLDKLPKSVFRELMFENLALRTGLSRNLLQELIQEARSNPETSAITVKTTPITLPKTNRPQAPSTPAPANPLPSTDKSTLDAPDWPDYYDNDVPPPQYEEYYSGPSRRTTNNNPRAGSAKRLAISPSQKAIALLISYPSLALHAPENPAWSQAQDDDLSTLHNLLNLLRERPHYNLSHLIGYWRGTYGPEATEKLANIAGSDLLQAASALTQPRQDKPAKIDYDTEAAFLGCLETLDRLHHEKNHANSLEKLKNTDLNQLSKSERDTLIRAALITKTTQSE
jgi:DNA primase